MAECNDCPRGPEMDRLSELWSRIGDLNSKETAELYRLLWQILGRYHPSILDSLPFAHEDCFQEFVIYKVIEGRAGGGGPRRISKGFVITAFRNFLLDRLDAAKRDPIDLSVHARDNGEEESSTNPVDLVPARAEDAADARQAPAQIKLHPECDTDSAPSPVEVLKSAGYDPKRIAEAARAFFDCKPEWVLLYMALNHCPQEEDQIPLAKIAEAYRIPSYHYKAVKLGIAVPGAALPEYYDKTMIGAWLTETIEVPISIAYARLIDAALQFLCEQALYVWAERNGPNRISQP